MGEIRLNKSGSGGASQKYLMKATYNTLQTSIQNFDKLVYEYENEPSRYPDISQREMTKRIKKIKEFRTYVDDEVFNKYNAGGVAVNNDGN